MKGITPQEALARQIRRLGEQPPLLAGVVVLNYEPGSFGPWRAQLKV